MAEVYKAQDQVLGRVVAVKVMLPQYAADPDFTARFKQEAASAANLQSPYIVNVYDWGQDEGTYFIVMEFIRGTDLKSAINQRGAINQRKVAEIGSQVCQALSVAHNQDIMHRDIKPQNIMVQPDGNVKVMDFGIARAKNSVKAQTSSVLGTAHYISPEQAQGKELTGASDMYSLGCVLYEAATGQLPFDGPDAVSVAMKQVNEEPLPPSQVKPDIHPDLEAIILTAMDKNPYARFQTARDMKHALDDFLMGRPVNLGGAMGSAATAVLGGIPGGGMMGAGATEVLSGGTSALPMLDSELGGAGKTSNYRAGGDFDMDKGKKKSSKKTAGIAVGLIVALVAVAAVAAFALGLFGGHKVPDVVGQTKESAIEAIEAAGYEVGEVTEEFDAEVVAGRVCAQDPEGGTELEEGEVVNIVISKGVKKGAIPNLSGLTSKEAEDALKKAGFEPQYAGNEASDAKKDTVSRQDPAPGEKRDEGTVVKYWISTGPEEVEVPNVTGEWKDDAIGILNNAGFEVNVVDGDYSDSYEEGQVMAQEPNGGKLPKGSTVTITVSPGSEPTYNLSALGFYVGMTVAEAQSICSAAGVPLNGSYDSSYIVVGWSPSGDATYDTGVSLTVQPPSTPEPEPEPETDEEYTEEGAESTEG